MKTNTIHIKNILFDYVNIEGSIDLTILRKINYVKVGYISELQVFGKPIYERVHTTVCLLGVVFSISKFVK